MSNYKGHTYFNLLFFLPVALAIIWYFISRRPVDLMIFEGSFAYGTLFMSPDLDVANKIKLFSFRGVMTLPFRSYAYLFRHRGISHSVIFGTLTRVFWIFSQVLLIAYLFYNVQPDIETFQHYLFNYKNELMYAFSGLFIADVAHIFLDRVS